MILGVYIFILHSKPDSFAPYWSCRKCHAGRLRLKFCSDIVGLWSSAFLVSAKIVTKYENKKIHLHSFITYTDVSECVGVEYKRETRDGWIGRLKAITQHLSLSALLAMLRISRRGRLAFGASVWGVLSEGSPTFSINLQTFCARAALRSLPQPEVHTQSFRFN